MRKIDIEAPLNWPDHDTEKEAEFLDNIEQQLMEIEVSSAESLYTGFFTEDPTRILSDQSKLQRTRAYTLRQWREWLDCGVTPLLYALSPNGKDGASCIAVYNADRLERNARAEDDVTMHYYPKSGLLVHSLVAVIFVQQTKI